MYLVEFFLGLLDSKESSNTSFFLHRIFHYHYQITHLMVMLMLFQMMPLSGETVTGMALVTILVEIMLMNALVNMVLQV